ncbi:MAG: AAA family ATPase [Butyrivibrio sp.]
MENFAIAITRTCGSGATSISKILGERLGVNVYDRNLLRLASDDSGINEELFAKADEHMKQSLLYKVSRKVYKGELIGPDSDDFTSNENLFNYQAKVLKELAANESLICIGRAADFILKDHPKLITVFFHAPMEQRIKREMELTGFDEVRAEQYILKTDRYRREFYKYHTGRDWENPYNYDLCLNTGVFTYEKCVDIILNYFKTRFDEV